MKPMALLLPLLMTGCWEEPEDLPYSELVNLSVVETYRVDSMTRTGERCGWYVTKPVGKKLFDSIYLCCSMKIGDTLKLPIDHGSAGPGHGGCYEHVMVVKELPQADQ